MRDRVRCLPSFVAVVIAVGLLVSGRLLPVPKASAAAPVGTTWSASASGLSGPNGARFTFFCPPGGTAGSVWGTYTYTNDSSVCTAAVHMGLITFAQGGTVTIQLAPGLARYVGSIRNGVATSSYGRWNASFVFPSASPPAPTDVLEGGSGWTATATAYEGNIGARFTFFCPPGGTAATVWGTYTYTNDSSVCTAAVHMGLITFAQGGAVTIQIAPGLGQYVGSIRNGVTTDSYGRWSGSFTFSGASPQPAVVATATATATAANAPGTTATSVVAPVAAVVTTGTNQIGPTTAGAISLDTTLAARGSAGQALPPTTQQFHLLIPSSAVGQQTRFTAGVVAPAAVPLAVGRPGVANNVGVGAAYSLGATSAVTHTAVTQFSRQLVLQLSYDPAEIQGVGLDPGKLTIAYFVPAASPGGTGRWVGVPTTALSGTTLLTARLTHFTLYQVRATARTQAQVKSAQARLATLAAAGAPRVTVLPAAPVLGGVPVIVTLPRGQLFQVPLVSVIAAPGATISVTFRWGKASVTQTAMANAQGLATLTFRPPAGFPTTGTRVGVVVQVRKGTQSHLFSGSFVLVLSGAGSGVQATLSAISVRSGQSLMVTVSTSPEMLVAVDVVGPGQRILASQHGQAAGARYVATLRLTVGAHDPARQVLQVVVTVRSGTQVARRTFSVVLLR